MSGLAASTWLIIEAWAPGSASELRSLASEPVVWSVPATTTTAS